MAVSGPTGTSFTATFSAGQLVNCVMTGDYPYSLGNPATSPAAVGGWWLTMGYSGGLRVFGSAD